MMEISQITPRFLWKSIEQRMQHTMHGKGLTESRPWVSFPRPAIHISPVNGSGLLRLRRKQSNRPKEKERKADTVCLLAYL